MNDKDHERTSEPQPEPIIRVEDFEKFSAPTGHHTGTLDSGGEGGGQGSEQSSGSTSGSGGSSTSGSDKTASDKS